MKNILITGASRGCGRALTEEFIRLGHTVIGCSRTEAAVLELTAAHPAPHRFHVIDVTNDEAVKEWAAQMKGSVPDLILNNAGLINHPAPFWEVPTAEFDCVVDVNLKGTANVLRHFVPLLLERGRGVICNLSSGWGRSTSPEVAPYCATKWAVEGLTAALAAELPSGVAAFAVNPGIINTEMLQTAFGPSASSYPTPEAWAKTAAPFLLSIKPGDSHVQLSIP